MPQACEPSPKPAGTPYEVMASLRQAYANAMLQLAQQKTFYIQSGQAEMAAMCRDLEHRLQQSEAILRGSAPSL